MQLNPIRSVVIMLIFIITTTPIIAVATSGEDEKEYSSSYRLHAVLEDVNNGENENASYDQFAQLKQSIKGKIGTENYEQRQEEIIERIEKEKEEEREKDLENRRKAEEAEAARLAEIEEEKRQQDAEEQAQADREAEEQRLKEEEQERIGQEEAAEETKEEVVQDVSEQNEDFIDESEPVEEEVAEDVEQVETKSFNTETYVVTAYTAGAESTDKNPGDAGYGVTASGEMVQEGHTIACPPHLDFGTEVHIPSNGGTYTCEDRGADIQGNRLDIYMNDLGQARSFGRQEMEVEIR
ncbi:3D domain-containing protein [Oceanobacillus oncorhynchi]|uniref:3D domain-containing protein n=1 Tax=Oceanobacillus oncorhynchi TaxID=545501 RepID=UPI0034D51E1D